MTQAVNTTPASTAWAENDGSLTPAIKTTCLPTTLTHDTEVITPHQTDDNYSPYWGDKLISIYIERLII